MSPRPKRTIRHRALPVFVVWLLVLTACSPKRTEVNREIELVFDFVNIDPADSGVSQLLWESVAALGGRKDNEPMTRKQRRHHLVKDPEAFFPQHNPTLKSEEPLWNVFGGWVAAW